MEVAFVSDLACLQDQRDLHINIFWLAEENAHWSHPELKV